MSDKRKDLDLAAFSEVVGWLALREFRATIIGGIAVGAYAGMAGETSLSGDLDFYVTPAEQGRLQSAVRDVGATIVARPRPRSIPTLVVDWHGLELNALVRSSAPLPSPEQAYERAWLFGEARVLDPFDLLQNKLGLTREKDRPHVALLTDFLDLLTEAKFAERTATPRQRLREAKEYLRAQGRRRLSRELFEKLAPHADTIELRRFLVNRAPDDHLARRVIADAPENEREPLQAVYRRR